MFKNFRITVSGRAAAAAAASLLSLTSFASAQTPEQTPQPRSRQTATTSEARPTESAGRAGAQSAAVEAVAARPSAEPLYGEYRGVKLGMSAEEVRSKLGRPEEKSDGMDFFVFSGTERARVYYSNGKASAVIATYIGRDARAPAPAAVLGTEIEAKPDGSMYKMTAYPQAGYWVAYSRTVGDSPMVIVTMQKMP